MGSKNMGPGDVTWHSTPLLLHLLFPLLYCYPTAGEFMGRSDPK